MSHFFVSIYGGISISLLTWLVCSAKLAISSAVPIIFCGIVLEWLALYGWRCIDFLHLEPLNIVFYFSQSTRSWWTAWQRSFACWSRASWGRCARRNCCPAAPNPTLLPSRTSRKSKSPAFKSNSNPFNFALAVKNRPGLVVGRVSIFSGVDLPAPGRRKESLFVVPIKFSVRLFLVVEQIDISY